MTKPTVYVLIGLGLAPVAWFLYRQSAENLTLRNDLQSLRDEKTEAVRSLAARELETKKLEQLLLTSESAQAGLSSGNDESFRNALAPWFENVRKLSAYASKHPELWILQMKLLSPSDWLDVTKGGIETEAEYREGLGKLRGQARQKLASIIGDALSQAIVANGNRLPASPLALAPYLPSEVDPTILRQLELNPSGKIPGLASQQRYVLVDTPLDLWDSTLFYSEDGGWGVKSANAPGSIAVSSAITQFVKDTGHLPTSAAQLAQYPGIASIDKSTLSELFKALTTKPNP